MMKKVTILLSGLFVAMALFVNCGGEKKSDNPLIGKWKVTEAEGPMSDLSIGTIYNFIDDTNLSLERESFKNQAKYKVSGDTISYSVGKITVDANFKIEGNKLTYKIINGSQTFIMVKE